MALKSVTEVVEALQGTSLLDETQLRELQTKISHQFPDAVEASKEMIRRKWLTMYQAKMILVGRVKNLFLDKYVLLDLLGEGGMGQVYKARHQRLDRVDALKVIRPIHVQSADALRRFLREARAAAHVSHPNIVAIYDAGEDNGTHYLAMEFVPGADLSGLVRKNGPFSWEAACEYLRQAAVGLQHAQHRGMVHRDIKPANLLLTADRSTIKILDMGLARLHELDGRQQSINELTQTGVVMGTPDYMAPEQAIDSRLVDARADIYSLGCTLYFLLSGQPPFPQGSLTQKLIWHQQRAPEPLSKHNVTIPPTLALVLERMMAKKAEDRYQTAGEVAQALSGFARLPEGIVLDPAIAGSRSDGTLKISKLKHETNTPGGHTPGGAKTKIGDSSLGTYPASKASEAPSTSNVDDETLTRPPSPKKAVGAPKAGPPPLPPMPLDRTEKVEANKVPKPAAKSPDDEDEDDHEESSGFWSNTLSSVVSILVVIALTSGVGWFMNRPGDADSAPPPGTGIGPANYTKPNAGAKADDAARKDDDRKDDDRTVIQPLIVYTDHEKPVHAVAFSNDGLKIVSAGSDQRVIVWLVNTEKGERILENFADVVYTVDWCATKDWILTGGKSKTGINNISCKIYEVTDGTTPRQRSLAPVKMTIRSGVFSPLGDLALLGGGVQRQGLVQLWDTKTAKLLYDLPGHEDVVMKVAFSPQGDIAASCSLDKTIRIWDVQDGSQIGLIRLSSPALSLAFSQDGKTLCSGGEDNLIRLWDWKTASEDGVLTGHTKAVLALALAPNGKHLVSGSGDKSVRVWDLVKKKEIYRIDAHEDIVTGVAIQPNGQKLASCSQDGTVKIWAMPPK